MSIANLGFSFLCWFILSSKLQFKYFISIILIFISKDQSFWHYVIFKSYFQFSNKNGIFISHLMIWCFNNEFLCLMITHFRNSYFFFNCCCYSRYMFKIDRQVFIILLYFNNVFYMSNKLDKSNNLIEDFVVIWLNF